MVSHTDRITGFILPLMGLSGMLGDWFYFSFCTFGNFVRNYVFTKYIDVMVGARPAMFANPF